VHIGGFDKTATEADLKKLFVGSAEFTLPIKKDTKLNMGFAFASYASEDAATKAINSLNGKDFNGKKLSVVHAFVRSEKVEKKVAEKKAATSVEPATKKVKADNGKAVEAKKAAVDSVAPIKKDKVTQEKGSLKRKAEEEDEDEDEDGIYKFCLICFLKFWY